MGGMNSKNKNEYSKIIPFDINSIKNFYIFADHGALGLYLLKYIFGRRKRFVF